MYYNIIVYNIIEYDNYIHYIAHVADCSQILDILMHTFITVHVPPIKPPIKKHIPTPMVTHHLALIDSSPKA